MQMNQAIDAPKPFTLTSGGPANTGSALNIHVYLRSSAADCFFQVQRSARSSKAAPRQGRNESAERQIAEAPHKRRDEIRAASEKSYIEHGLGGGWQRSLHWHAPC